MVRICKFITSIFLIILFVGCASKAISVKDEILQQYNQGIEYYNNKKYSKARESFKYVILHSSGSRLALESEFYLAESFYNLKEYMEALYSYDNYARSSQDIKLIELSRFRICECAHKLSPGYRKDQSTTTDALDKIEIFLEDYPNSEYYTSILELRQDLRYKLAMKEYESARLYMKLGEYKSALIYLSEALSNYSDLKIADDIRIAIIFSYILNDSHGFAIDFYKREIDSFSDIKKKEDAIELINSTENSIKLTEYLRIFK